MSKDLFELVLVCAVVFGPILAIVAAFSVQDFMGARNEKKRLAEGGEIFDEIPAGLSIRPPKRRLEHLAPKQVEPQSYTWTERRPNEPARPQRPFSD